MHFLTNGPRGAEVNPTFERPGAIEPTAIERFLIRALRLIELAVFPGLVRML